MTSYDQTKMTELEHTNIVQRGITSKNRHKRYSLNCWDPTKI